MKPELNQKQIEELDELLITAAAKKLAEVQGVTDQSRILELTQEMRKSHKEGRVLFTTEPKVLDAMQNGEPYDKSLLIAANPYRQEELDKWTGATRLDKAKRFVREKLKTLSTK